MSTNLKELAIAAYKVGLLQGFDLSEFRRWGIDVGEYEDPPPLTPDLQLIVSALDSALQGEGLIIERVTDVDLAKQYIQTAKVGSLVVWIGTESATFPVSYGTSPAGDIILAWRGDSIVEEMTNGATHLTTAEGTDVYFSAVREMFFGDTKAFMLCTPSRGGSDA